MEPRGTRDKEQNMKGDKTVIEYLNKALRHELTAVNQYWSSATTEALTVAEEGPA